MSSILRLRNLSRKKMVKNVAFIFVLAGLVFAANGAFAQSELPERALKELQKLPPNVQNTVKQLAALGELPPPQWRVHSADIAHGEATDLDDSGWEVAKVHAEGPKTGLWYRAWVEVPKDLNGYDLTGSKISFEFDIDIGGGSGAEIL